MRWNKTSHWIIVVAALAVWSILILTRANAVQATFTDMHMMTVMFRVESEIMQKTPAGQYYDSLFWKHSEEIAQLIEATPGKLEELIRVNRLFIPGLEALLDGRGNEVRITSEQVKEFEDELNWFVSVGSPSLREDIQRARQRLPLDHFIGMTMDEALNYINSSWTPDMIVQPTKTPIPQTAVPYSTIQIATRESQKTLVQKSDGKWAYYVLNSVYFEYPAHYYYQAFEAIAKILFLLVHWTEGIHGK